MPFGMLLGRPLIPVEHMSTIGDVGDIMLVDLSAYATGLRGGGIRSAVSIHLRFDFNETAFRFLFEMDGQPFVNTPLTPAQGANTISTHVTLAARAG
jgi:HK97 family phage major capsid protein